MEIWQFDFEEDCFALTGLGEFGDDYPGLQPGL
jgi:hypothetical protein